MLQKYITYLQTEKRYSPKTIIAYENDLRQFFEYYQISLQNIDLSIFTKQNIRNWIYDLMTVHNENARSVHRKLSSLSGFCKYMMRCKQMTSNPVAQITAPKTPKRLPVFLDEKRLNNYLDITDDVEDTYAAVRNQTIIEMLYATGMRRAELINIKVSDVYEAYIKVLGKGDKERIIPMTEHIKKWVNRLIIKRQETFATADNNFLFLTDTGKQIYPNFVYRLIHNDLTIAGFAGKRSPHILRHTFATDMLNNGADLNAIKTILGHTSLAATQVYTHNTFEKLKKVYKKAHPRA